MLYLVTGQPGNGKTLYTLNYVEAMRVKEGRAVYQNGISGLTLPWKEFESPDKWEELPNGSIVVVDEAWRTDPPCFGLRGTTKAPPAYVGNLATHRHRGMDIFLVTQGVGQIDPFVRALVGKHFHLDRKFGMETSTLWQWERAANPTSSTDKREGQSSRWTFPKESFEWYKSAVEHTHKRNLPWKKLAVLGIGVGMCVMGGSCAYRSLERNKGPAAGEKTGSSLVAGAVKRLVDPADAYWKESRVQRVDGVAASAPMFDPLQKVATQPRIEGCMQMVYGDRVDCSCTGPNGSRLAVRTDQCVELVKKGWFDETRKYEDSKAANVAYLNSLEKGSDGESSSAGVQGNSTATARP